MAVREPLDVVLPSPRVLRFRPPLSSLLPAADAMALGTVYVLVGFHPVAIVFAVLTFLILNSDSSRIFRINPRLGDDAAWLLGRVALSLLLLVSVEALGIASERTLIVGEGELAGGLAKTLLEHQEFGLRPVGFLGRTDAGSDIL